MKNGPKIFYEVWTPINKTLADIIGIRHTTDIFMSILVEFRS